mmetsp:Transcript_5377/g.11039  ORF Transcript_5377/g.11039 Transcript_5377/m.11039 type:complete len:364 (-) Transcript_5377:544-1635(-)
MDLKMSALEKTVGEMGDEVPVMAKEAVLVRCLGVPADAETVRGYDFNCGVDYDCLLESFSHTGFQATSFGRATQILTRMLHWRPTEDMVREGEAAVTDRATIFLGFTSNLVSSGVRETIRYLTQHHKVDVLVTTAGGIEEDLIKCLAPTILGDFRLRGQELRQQGLNRIGNLLVPNDNYCKFEDWVLPILSEMLEEQNQDSVSWTPSKIIHRLGKALDNDDSICTWAYRNNIPVFCPALTDGSLGDMLFFHSYRNPGLKLDILEDLCRLNRIALHAKCTGMVILGGGVVKHHICNANLMRNGADFAVYVNTGQEFDGSDSGASPDEAVSWGKIRADGDTVKVFGDATILFPLLVAKTFAQIDR